MSSLINLSTLFSEAPSTWRNSQIDYLRGKVDGAGLSTIAADFYRRFGAGMADWYDDNIARVNEEAFGELNLPGKAVHSVLAHGASMDPNVDSTAAFQEALDNCSADGGGIVLVPPVLNIASQRYTIQGTGITIPPNVQLVGAGTRSMLRCRPNAGEAAISFASGINRGGARDLVLLGNDAAPLGIGVSFVGSQRNRIENLQIWDFVIGVDVSDTTPFSAYNLAVDVEINRCTSRGYRIQQSANGITIIGGRVFYTFDGANGAVAVDIEDARAVSILGLAVEAYDIGLRVANECSFGWFGGWMEKGANVAPGTNRRDFVISSFAESAFFEGTLEFRGVHHTDALPSVLGNRSVDKLGADEAHLEFRSDYERRWRILHTTTEGLSFERWTAGVLSETPIALPVAGGVTVMTNWTWSSTQLTVAGAASRITLGDPAVGGNAGFRLQKPEASNESFMTLANGTTAASERWVWQHSSAEDINFIRLDTSGAVLDTPLRIRHDAGLGAGRGAVSVTRIYADLGNAIVAGDFALSAGWGATATVSAIVTGTKDMRGRITVTSAGAGQAANPTITLTFHDGTFGTIPIAIACRCGGSQRTVPVEVTTTATTMTITFLGTPVPAETYIIAWQLSG
jgi:hypothetical protein